MLQIVTNERMKHKSIHKFICVSICPYLDLSMLVTMSVIIIATVITVMLVSDDDVVLKTFSCMYLK